MTSTVGWTYELHVAPETTSPAQTRHFVEQYLIEHNLAYLVDVVCLVASELVTNAVVHARSRIQVRLEELPSYVKLTVYDQAVNQPVPSRAFRAGADDESGRGLWLVDACTDAWGTELAGDEGKCTWALFAVRPSSS